MRKKIITAVGIIVLAAVVVYDYEKFFSEEEKTVEAEVEENAKTIVPVVVSDSGKLEVKIPENPFISNKQLAARTTEKNTAKEEENKEEAAPTKGTAATAPIVLPSIPRTEVSQTTPIQMPSIVSNPAIQTTLAPEKESNVQGIITTDKGKSIAIMSDGEILTEGERYMDGRIAYIGGDGVEMDNGKKFKLKE